MTDKKKIPPLKKKNRRLADLDPTSLTAALHHQELSQEEKPDAGDQAQEEKPDAGGQAQEEKPH